MHIAYWIAGIASVVALTIFAAIKRMHTKSSSIGTSPLVDQVAVTASDSK
jgi:hypothetical protein